MANPKRAEFTDDEVEAVAKALFATEEPDRNAWRWSKPCPDDPAGPLAWHDYWLDAARAALVPLTAVKAAAKERDNCTTCAASRTHDKAPTREDDR